MIQAIKRHLKKSGLTRRNNSSNNNKQRKEDENGLENVTQTYPPPDEMVPSNTETVPVKMMTTTTMTHDEPNPIPVINNNNNNNENNVININNQRNQHNQRHHHHHQHAGLSSPESSSSSSSYPNDKRRRRGGNDGQSSNDQLIAVVDDTNLISPLTYRVDDNGANQSTNCAQVNEKHQQQPSDNDHHDDNLNSNTMTVDSDNQLTTSSLVNEAYRTECIQLRQRVRELEQQNRLLTLLLAEQLLNSSTNSVGNQSKLDKLMAINSLTNNQPQSFISEYESTLLMENNNSNHDEVSSSIIMNLSSLSGQGQNTMTSGECKRIISESDYCRSMENNHSDHHHHHHSLSNNNNHHHHHDDDDETSDRLVSMSECNSMLGVNLTHVNIDRRGKVDDDNKSKTTTTTTQLTSQPNLPVNQLTSNQIVPLSPIITTTTTPSSSSSSSVTTINSTTINYQPISSFDSRAKSSYNNNLIINKSTLFTLSSSSSTSTTTTAPSTVTTSSSSSSPSLSTSNPLSTTISNTVIPTFSDTTTSTLSTLTSTLIGSPSSSSSSPPQSPKKLISTSSSILDSSLFQSTNNPVNCSSSSSSTTTNQLEKRILFILASNNNNNHNCYNSTFSSTSSSSSSVSTENNNKIYCDNINRLINKPGNLALRTLSGSSSSLKDNNCSLLSSSSIKSIVSIEKDSSPASSATSFDSNGELTSKDEGYSTMSSDVQSDIGGNTGSSPIVTTNTNPLTSLTTTTTIKNESTINSLLLDDKQSTINNGNTTNKINKSFRILNSTTSPPPTPPRTFQLPQSTSSSSSPSLSTLIHLKQHQQFKGETIEIKSEPKKMGINGSPTNSIPLTIMSTVNPIVVGSSRLTTFKSSNQNDCLITSPSTINKSKNNQMDSPDGDNDDDDAGNLLIEETIKLNCNNNDNTVMTIKDNNLSQSIIMKNGITINSNLLADNKSSSWLNNNSNGTNEGNESQSSFNCFTSIVNNNVNGSNFIRKSRKTINGKSSTHRYTFPPVTTRNVTTTTTTTIDGIEWTPCLIYQPSKSTFDHHHHQPQVDNLIISNEPRLIVTAEKSTSADLDADETKCLVNNREVIICEEKRKRSGKYHHSHHHHLGKDDHVNDEQFDGKINQLNQVQTESIGDWKVGVGGEGEKRKSSVSKGVDCGSLMMQTTRSTVDDDDDDDEYDDYEEEEEDEEEENKKLYKIDQKRKLKVHHKLQPPPLHGSISSSHGSQLLTRWHSDSKLYSDSLVKQDSPLTSMMMMRGEDGKRVNFGRPSNHYYHRSPRRRRDVTNVHLPSQSFSSTCKRSSGYIRRRIKREDRARLDESHRWSTLSTSSSALSDGLEAPIYCERRRYRPRLPITITTTTIDNNTGGSIGIGNLSKVNTKNTLEPCTSGRLIRYISSDENHSADDEDSSERFVSHWLHKSGGGLRWDDSEVTWKLNESIDWPEPIELEDSSCLNHLSSSSSTTTTSSPSSSAAAVIKSPSSSSDDNRITNNLNNDDTFEEIPLIDDDSSESEKIEITSTINNNYSHYNHNRHTYSVLISPCNDQEVDEEVDCCNGIDGGGGGCNGGLGVGIDVSHEGGGEGYISSDQASSVPDDGLTPETHFNGDFYRLCSVGSRTSLQQPDDEISLPPSSSGALSSLSSSSSPPLTDVKEQDEEEDDNNCVNHDSNETKIILQPLTQSNDLDGDYDELLVITTTTSIDGKNHHQLKSFNHQEEHQKSTSLIKSQSNGYDVESISPRVKLDQQINDCKQFNSSQSTNCLSSSSSSPSSSSPSKSVKFGQSNDDNKETTTINTGSESQSIDCKETFEGKQLVKPIIADERSVDSKNNINEHGTIKDDHCHIYEEINQIESKSSQLTSSKTLTSPSSIKINRYPKPILIKSSSTNQASSSPTRIPLPKQSNSLDAIKTNNKDGFKLRFNSTATTTTTMIDSITNNQNNVNNLITKSFINQHQVKRLNNNNTMVNCDQNVHEHQPSTSSSSSSSLLLSKKLSTESRSKMLIELKGKMENNNNQVNHHHNRSADHRKLNQSIPSLEEFERRLSEDKQMADKIREFYSIFEQSTQSSSSSSSALITTSTKSTPTTTTTTTTTTTIPPPVTTITPTINSTTTTTASIKGVKSNRSRSNISTDLIKGIKLNNNERPVFEDIKSKLKNPKLLRSKGIVGLGSTGTGSGGGGTGINNNNNNNCTGGSDSGKTMKEGHETSWVHVSGFTVGKVSEPPPPQPQPPPPSSLTLSSLPLVSPSPSSVINSITTSINQRNLINSGKASSDSCSSEDEFNLGNIHGAGGKKRSSFHQRLLALHRSRRQRKRASDCYMGMSWLPKIRASIVDRLDFYHRFGDKEQEALTSFNFLNDLPGPTSTPTTTTTTTSTHSNPKSTKSYASVSSGSTDCHFVEEQQLLIRCYLNSFQPLTTPSSSSTQSLPPPPPVPQTPPSSATSSSSSSFTLSSYKWPQSPIKSSSSSSPRYQSSVGNNYILNHELTKRPVGGVS